MKITEIRVKLMGTRADGGEKLKAFCSVTFDNEIVIRDLKVIDGSKGLFVAMPSRKLAARCPKCSTKNAVRARYCNECGFKLRRKDDDITDPGRRLYADVAHPIHTGAREHLQHAVLAAYKSELDASRKSDYVPPRFDDLDYDELAPRPPKPREEGQAEGAM